MLPPTITIFVKDYEGMQSQIADMDYRLKYLSNSLHEAIAKQESLQHTCNNHEMDYHDIKTKYNDMTKKYDQLETEYYDIAYGYGDLEDKYQILEQEKAELRRVIKNMTAKQGIYCIKSLLSILFKKSLRYNL